MTKEAKQTTEVGIDYVPATPEQNLPAVQLNTPMSMLSVAVNRGMDAKTISDLMALQERWEAGEAKKAFNVAFSAFKAEAVRVIKNRTVDQGPLKDKKYAELFAVVNAVTPALSQHGLSASWSITKDEKDWIEVTCSLKHVLGHSESVSMGGPPDAGGAKSAIQSRASTVSYLERYTLKAICGISEQDDDNDGGGSKGMPEEEILHWESMITEKTTKEDAKESWKTANKACAGYNDVTAGNRLKNVLLEHGKKLDEIGEKK